MKHQFLTILLFAFILVSCETSKQKETKPNIIVFLVDDLGWNDTSLALSGESTKYNQRYKTPNLEKLANQGLTLTNAHSNAICVPSRASLLTGQNFMRHQVKGDIIPQFNKRGTLEFPPAKVIAEPKNMLPAVLKRNGYKTIHAGKYHACHRCPPEKSPTPEAAGFDVNIGGTGYGAPANYYGIDSFQINNSNRPMPGLEAYFGKDIHLTEALTIESMKHAKKAVDNNEPFFLYLSHYAVHTPIQKHNPYRDEVVLEEGEPEDEADYASMIKGVDVSLGQVMKSLDEWGIADNTLLIFYSDNGGRVLLRGKKSLYGAYEFNYPLRSGKASLYQGGIQVPAVVRWPGKIEKGTELDKPTMIEDIYATVVGAAGIDYPKNYNVDGLSWLPLFENISNPPEIYTYRPLFFFMPYRFDGIEFNGEDFADGGVAASAVVIENNWKLIYFFEEERFELYNLTDDIGEKSNLIEVKPEKSIALVKILDQNMKEREIVITPYRLPERVKVKFPLEAWNDIN